ncbi:fimbria/pilus outer membrane usher protein [Rahnella contaminans]|uniref:fimbria/pilus outer membrane usher protein n=1 Tax=Rahnella contaminans TaxID=2703882 RepID=UPI003C2B3948
MPKSKSVFSLILLIFVQSPVNAGDYFDPSMLESVTGQKHINSLDKFTKNNFEDNKKYLTTVSVNGVEVGDMNYLYLTDKNGDLSPSLSVTDLLSFGVRKSIIDNIKDKSFFITDIIPDATVKSEIKEQKTEITIPQTDMDGKSEQDILLDHVNEGISGLLSSYSYSGNNTMSKNNQEADTSSQFLNLNNSLNLGAWRLKNTSSWSKDKESPSKWESSQTYIERDIIPLKSTLTAGQLVSSNKLFESFNFNGFQLSSEDSMYSDTMMSFAPAIMGIAKSNAKVTIKQNNFQIYQTFVPPGPFSITDYNASANGGNIDVTITESDGSERHQIQGFSSIPLLQRQGKIDYEIIGGKYRQTGSSDSSSNAQGFSQLTLFYGLPKNFTVYGGAMTAINYKSFGYGVGYDMGEFGAISVDRTNTNNQEDKDTGYRNQISYAKYFTLIGSTLNASAQRYSLHYQNFKDSQDGSDSTTWNDDIDTGTKSSSTLALNKSFADYGNVNINYNNYHYWGNQNPQKSIELSYSNSIKSIGYSVSFSQNESEKNDKQIAINLSIPVQSLLSNATVSYTFTHDNSGHTVNQANLTGSTLKDNNLSYSLNADAENEKDNDNWGGNLHYTGSQGAIESGYSADKYQRNLTYGATGSVLVHPHGITLGQQSTGTTGLVYAEHVKNGDISDHTGVETDGQGYALIPDLQNYRTNEVSLDPESLGSHVNVAKLVMKEIPSKDAIVPFVFATTTGDKIYFIIKGKNNIPFGSEADISGITQIVSDGGVVYFPSAPSQGVLDVTWFDETPHECSMPYNIRTLTASHSGVFKINLVCVEKNV